jgi:catechol 2,3-dioxygenase-like lactoylglutathione lyase family enzyme
MSIRRVVPNIASDKPDASRDFYTGLLGFQVAMDMVWILTLVSPTNSTAQLSVLRQDATASRSSPSRSPASTPSMPRSCGAALSWCIR